MVFGIAAIVIETRRQERRIAIVGFLTMFLGYTVYSFGLLLMYLYSFGSYEGTRVASFTRYMGIFLLAWTVVTWGFMLSTGEQKEKNSPKIVQGLFVIFILFLTPIKSALFALTQPKPLPVRMEIKKILSNTIPNLKRGERVYVIWQNTTGFEPWIISYELSPRNSTSVASSGWSLGRPYYEGDVWTSDIDPKTWSENILVNYDFLLLASVDEYFWSRYASVFKSTLNLKSNKLFRVVKKENGKIDLEVVDLTSNPKSEN
ncbi:putative membrane protein [Leptospira interrogans]|nr:putative membrane protein [Leptospira interrogans]OCC28825.1 putative membrane protein [Leptospira interrogans serovar Canicola]